MPDKSPYYRVTATCVGLFLFSHLALGQHAGDWSLAGNDPGHTGWQKFEQKLTSDNAAQDFRFLWKLQLGKPSDGADSFTEPLLRQGLINSRGFKDLVFWANADTLYAVDDELGRVEWEKHYDLARRPAAKGCSSANMGLLIEPPHVINFNAHRKPGHAPAPEPGPVPAGERRLGMQAGGGYFGMQGIYVLTGDGYLHEQVLATGHDYAPPVQFLPVASDDAAGLNISGQTIFAVKAEGCPDLPNAAWALHMTPSGYPVSSYPLQGLHALNLTGLPVTPDGTAFLVTGNAASGDSAGLHPQSIVALRANEGSSLTVSDWYTPSGGFAPIQHVSPITFFYKGKELVVAPGPQGSIVLLDASSLGGADHHTPLFATPPLTEASAAHGWDGFAAWTSRDGTSWVIASIAAPVTAAPGSSIAHGALVAFRLDDSSGTPKLVQAWVSGDMINPAPPVIAGNVVIALAGGDRSSHAVLYVLDGATGRQLFSSGDTIPTYSQFSGLSFGDSHAYFTDHEHTLYAFGIGMEH